MTNRFLFRDANRKGTTVCVTISDVSPNLEETKHLRSRSWQASFANYRWADTCPRALRVKFHTAVQNAKVKHAWMMSRSTLLQKVIPANSCHLGRDAWTDASLHPVSNCNFWKLLAKRISSNFKINMIFKELTEAKNDSKDSVLKISQ